ncbi:MAG: cysteine synthase A, partial [Clostridia bacterium]|nr:cysteine synthase A [Clostridia bacterium]
SIDQLIGHTPLLELTNIEKIFNLKARLIAKLEFLNPAGSVKDRIAKAILDDMEQNGTINKETVIIEPTSGNTGIGLAAVGAARGYKIIIVMPDSMSIERQKLMTAYGAELILTDGVLGMSGAIAKAEELNRQIDNSVIAGQFTNTANPKAHFNTTGPEIYCDTDGDIDYFVAGIGTGGTITGIGNYLKSKNKNIKIIAVEPSDSPLLSSGKSASHKLQGIGANFIPDVLDTSVYDEIITVSSNDAFDKGRLIAKNEGVLVGISSGAALSAAIDIASRDENEGKTVVVLLPDTGDRYLSTEMFK